MRGINKLLLTALISASATTAFAANSADLAITGKISPTACTPTLAGGGKIDLGLIDKTILSSTAETYYSFVNQNWSIACDAPAKIMIKFLDNHPNGSSPTSQQYGVGKQGTTPIGYFTIQNGNPTLDGVIGATIVTKDDGATWIAPSGGSFFGQNLHYSFADTGTLIPKAYTNYSGTFQVKTWIKPTNTLDMTSEIDLNGLATLQMTYL